MIYIWPFGVATKRPRASGVASVSQMKKWRLRERDLSCGGTQPVRRCRRVARRSRPRLGSSCTPWLLRRPRLSTALCCFGEPPLRGPGRFGPGVPRPRPSWEAEGENDTPQRKGHDAPPCGPGPVTRSPGLGSVVTPQATARDEGRPDHGAGAATPPARAWLLPGRRPRGRPRPCSASPASPPPSGSRPGPLGLGVAFPAAATRGQQRARRPTRKCSAPA